MKFIIVTYLLFQALPLFADAPRPGKFRFGFGPYFYRSLIDSEVYTEEDSVKTGLSFNIEGGLPDSSGLEFQILFFEKRYFSDYNTSYRLNASPRVYITFAYRKWIVERLSFAVGLASHYSAGAEKNISEDGFETESVKLSSGREVSYAADASLQLELIHMDMADFVVDYRYSFHLFAKSGEESNHSALLLLFRQEIE